VAPNFIFVSAVGTKLPSLGLQQNGHCLLVRSTPPNRSRRASAIVASEKHQRRPGAIELMAMCVLVNVRWVVTRAPWVCVLKLSFPTQCAQCKSPLWPFTAAMMKALLIENRIGRMSPYNIFGTPNRCAFKNLLDPPKNLFQQHRPLTATPTNDPARRLCPPIAATPAVDHRGNSGPIGQYPAVVGYF
jgi:hypothetical protein